MLSITIFVAHSDSKAIICDKLVSKMTDQQFYITIGCVVALGIVLFIFTGFINVKKGFVAIIERAGIYIGTYQSGFRYFAPLVDRRVGLYKIGKCRRLVEVDRYKSYFLDYEITNFKDFHYSGHDLDGLVRLALNESPDDLSLSLKTRCALIGVCFIAIEINKK
ncbi:MAG: hypothetical protein GX816_02065 [Erysipelotrichia bacterium]|nr:hypothetical protein [Erysipelotrichia bacterium]